MSLATRSAGAVALDGFPWSDAFDFGIRSPNMRRDSQVDGSVATALNRRESKLPDGDQMALLIDPDGMTSGSCDVRVDDSRISET